MKKANGFIGKNDLYIAGLILLLSLLSFIPALANWEAAGGRVFVAAQETELFSVRLAQLKQGNVFTQSFASAAGPITFEFDPEKGVRVIGASCPDKICMHMSYINKPRQMIVCIPGKIYAAIEAPGTEGELDAISR
ncbi:MAG: NusG domain II-containing protein [Acidaminococcales bacterium]|jgi:hypothetical protein|nr:NusG domain II-containing protein [Acidaminococcales bacterium]